MSTKERNIIRPGFTYNFCKEHLCRYILIDDQNMNEDQKNQFVKDINERLFLAIQEVNMRLDTSSLPFIKAYHVVKDEGKLRIIITDLEHSNTLEDSIKDIHQITHETSHLINFKSVFPRRIVQVCDKLVPGDAKLLIGENDRKSAAIDILLDIAMFNSISFLRNLSIKEKKKFNLKKYGYAKKHGMGNYYQCNLDTPPEYWSFAFTARIDRNTIDYDLYIEHWRQFIEDYYLNCSHNIIAPEQQLENHIDKNNLPQEMFSSQYWKNYNKGAYLVLRINREANTDQRKSMICRLFGIKEFHVGATKIVPLNRYFEPFINRMLNELYLSAYKIVVG